MCLYFFLSSWFLSHWVFPWQCFNEATKNTKMIETQGKYYNSYEKVFLCSTVFEIKRIQENDQIIWRLMHYIKMAKFVSYKFVQVKTWMFHSLRRYPCYFQEARTSYRTTLSQRPRRMYTWGEVIACCTFFSFDYGFSLWIF